MSAANLIKIAQIKGYGIGKQAANVYYYGRNGETNLFHGTWQQFVKFIQSL